MYTFVKIFIVVVLALALIDWLADRDRRADTNIPNAKLGWAFLSSDAMHLDYIVLGLLIVGMLSAAAMALPQRKSH
jgi:hypothetical protein